ncbi:ABC-2 family transporter protein [Lactobacillus xylocopicola]|uniref:ABC transporter permease n=1 Tax=Lactobacillus xylocopicola TaxID=2976676 RepID=A0ABM8BF76_9LACO|nr:ABC-2 family transporter protein [Lactobacillus xylocopicola]BDR59757.1 hypothetical protein KIM322_00180 [Lactobacillus xylocopicola]
MVKKYLAIFYLGLKDSLIYRSNYVIKLIIQFVNLIVSLLMWSWISRKNSLIDYRSLAQYLVVTNITVLLFTTHPAFQLSNLIKSGKIVNFITKPVSLFWYLYFHNVGYSTPLFIFYFLMILFFKVQFKTMLLLLCYFVLAYLMFFSMMMLLGSLGFWVINMWPLRAGINAIYSLLGGLYFPLSLLGQKTYSWIHFNPFSLVTDIPARLISGMLDTHVVNNFCMLGIWTFIFLIGYCVLLTKGLHKYDGASV